MNRKREDKMLRTGPAEDWQEVVLLKELGAVGPAGTVVRVSRKTAEIWKIKGIAQPLDREEEEDGDHESS